MKEREKERKREKKLRIGERENLEISTIIKV
jgi:hypothetical protein